MNTPQQPQPNVLDQLNGQWQKILMVVMLMMQQGKVKADDKEIFVKPEDLIAFAQQTKHYLLVDGKGDNGFKLRLVDHAEMARLQYQAEQTGRSFKRRNA